jgi:hypothetical protein
MKKTLTAVSIGMLIAVAGCDRGTSGGPGASSPPSKANIMGQTDDTFSLSVPSADLYQGETETVAIEIKRGKNFGQDVSLKLGDLPEGVTVEPANPVIKHGDTRTEFALKARDDAALGDFTVSVTGHPTTGADAVAELKFSVAKRDPKDVADAAAEAAKAERDKYMDWTQAQWDGFAAQYEVMKERAGKAEGQLKTDLERQCAEAQAKLDAAAAKLKELKTASAESWQNFKQDVEGAFDDLRESLV